MTKVKCPFEYCRHIKAGICSKPTITIDDEGCLDLKLVGLTQKEKQPDKQYTKDNFRLNSPEMKKKRKELKELRKVGK